MTQGHKKQQAQEAGREAALLREAYRDMLLQQQTRHRTDLQKRQAKHQRQLEAQVWHVIKTLGIHTFECVFNSSSQQSTDRTLCAMLSSYRNKVLP